MDSLRYWVEVMHVDGFRFDLAAVLGRDGRRLPASAAFFDAVSQDPVLNRVKLIAEPWDIGTYEVGNFPVDWSEWNGRFRDTVRRFGKGDAGQLADLGWRLTGSADLYGDDGRSAYNSVNFVTCHDGFTLNDLVSLQRQAQRSQPREQPRRHQRQQVVELRRRRADRRSRHRWRCGGGWPRTTSATCCSRAGTPMMLGGDEFVRTQQRQQQRLLPGQRDLLVRLDAGRAQRRHARVRAQGASRSRAASRPCSAGSFSWRDLDDDGVPDLTWFGPDGGGPNWTDPELRTLCYQLDASEDQSDPGDYRCSSSSTPTMSQVGDACPRSRPVAAGTASSTPAWRLVTTSAEAGREVSLDPPDHYIANPRSTVVLVGRALLR